VTDQPSPEWIEAFKTSRARLDQALIQTPVDRTALLLAIGEGVSLLMTREMERLDPHAAKADHPDQMRLWAE
jgi:hypothetical protein